MQFLICSLHLSRLQQLSVLSLFAKMSIFILFHFYLFSFVHKLFHRNSTDLRLSESLFPESKSLFFKSFCICFQPLFVVVYHSSYSLIYSSGYLSIESNINSTSSECVTHYQQPIPPTCSIFAFQIKSTVHAYIFACSQGNVKVWFQRVINKTKQNKLLV